MLNKIRLAGITEDSIVDGPGFRLVFFAQGCKLHCPGCHNMSTWDPKGGEEYDIFELRKLWQKNPLIDGITISGGEPFLQKEVVLNLIELAKSDGMNIVVYSGNTFEELVNSKNSIVDKILLKTDYLIDGPFIIEKRSLNLAFRGSTNQRVIDLKSTLLSGQIITINKD